MQLFSYSSQEFKCLVQELQGNPKLPSDLPKDSRLLRTSSKEDFLAKTTISESGWESRLQHDTITTIARILICEDQVRLRKQIQFTQYVDPILSLFSGSRTTRTDASDGFVQGRCVVLMKTTYSHDLWLSHYGSSEQYEFVEYVP